METAGNNAPDKTDNEDLTYENASFVADLPGEATNANGVSTLATAKLAGHKWNHLVKKRRRAISRQQSRRDLPDCITIGSFVVDDEDENDTNKKKKRDPAQTKLNKQLISHFVDLARNNNNEDEVDLDFVEELLRKGADINCCDKHGQGMIHEAARAWHTDIMLFFIDHGANINLKDNYDRTALHIAAAVNYPDMVELLVDKGAYIEATTKIENQTPLHFAARNDAVQSLQSLIKLGADREARDYKQRTPIFVAAELDRSETAKFLIDVDADATVVDIHGQICMTHMITKMGPVARTALDQFHRKDRANRKQYFYLNLLEAPRMEKGKKATLAKTPLEVIVNFRQLDLIMHPVIMRLIELKWTQFGKQMAFRTLFHNFIFILVWTVLAVGVPWQTSSSYTFPQDWWRVMLLVIGCLMTVYYIVGEVREILKSRRRFVKWKEWRESQIQEDMKYCHPKWPEERKYLLREMETLDEMLPSYFQDFWNYFDWTVYFCILLVVLLHVIDVSLTNRTPPCCEAGGLCNDPDLAICSTGYVNNANLSVWYNRIFVITIIFLWLRLMKFTRAFRFFGPFIVMLGKLSWDILRFLYLYLEFYVPYACAFWMIFGQVDSIPSMLTVDQMLFSLYRITLVDDYDYDAMQTYDIVMAYFLIGSFLGISAILCINLFIALLSDTFQRVYDNANANAVMQQASLMLNFEENLSKRRMKKFREHIEAKCSPESMYYDDDLTVAQDADLKKVTIQIKQQMDELLEYIHKAESDTRHSFGNLFENQASEEEDDIQRNIRRKHSDDEDFSSPRGGRFKSKTFALKEALKLSAGGDTAEKGDMSKFSTRLSDLTSRIQRLQVSQTSQEESYKKLRDDMKDVKKMLSLLLPGENALGDTGTWAKSSDFSRSMSSIPPITFGSIVQQATEAEDAPRPQSSKRSSGRFKNLFGGGRKTSPKTISIPAPNSHGNRNSDRVELISIPGSVGGSPHVGVRSSDADNAPLTTAGVRTAEIRITDSSSSSFPPSSNV